MSKTIVAFLLPALAVAFTLNLQAEPAWTTTDVAPSDWAALSDNLIASQTGTINGTIATGFSTNDPGLLTDGKVQTTGGNAYRVGFQSGASVEWIFNVPKTLEQIRVSACYFDGSAYTQLAIAAVYLKLSGSDTWSQLDGSAFSDINGRSQNVIICATLSDSVAGYISHGVVGLKIAFGPPKNLASYCVEIEAVGFAETTGPVLGAFDITPLKTKAKISGSIADVGTDATACDVYLSVGNAPSVKIAESITGSFDYQIQGLTAGTTYAYELSISNNAPTAKGTVRSDEFTTLAVDAQTASWTQGEYAPADWAALGNNILRTLVATEKSGVSGYASQDMSKLTDGRVPSPAAGSETVGFQANGTIAWAFSTPMTIEKLRLSSLWESTLYNGISVSAIQVKFPNSVNWEALDVPTVQWTGGTQLGQTETLSDYETGFLAKNVVALKITFGAQKAAIANYYAEIEAVGHAERKNGVIVLVR